MEDRVNAAWAMCDVSGDGEIDAVDFRDILDTLGIPERVLGFGSQRHDKMNEVAETEANARAERQFVAEALMRMIDVGGNGSFDKKEFRKFMVLGPPVSARPAALDEAEDQRGIVEEKEPSRRQLQSSRYQVDPARA